MLLVIGKMGRKDVAGTGAPLSCGKLTPTLEKFPVSAACGGLYDVTRVNATLKSFGCANWPHAN